MLDAFKSKQSVKGFFIGVGATFATASILLMNPENMWRWMLNEAPSSEKVARALSTPSEMLIKAEKEISTLKLKLADKEVKHALATKDHNVRISSIISKNGELEKRNKIISEENEKLKADNHALKDKAQKNVSIEQDKMEIQGVAANELPMGEITAIENKSIILFNGKASITVTDINHIYNYCLISVFSLFDKNENKEVRIEPSSPAIIKLSDIEYIIHFTDAKYSSPNNKCVFNLYGV